MSRVSYDGYALLPVQTTDALGHTTTAIYDYRVLQARLVTDPNLNRTAYGFSPLGLLHETALLGKFGAGEGDIVSEAVPATASSPAQPLRYQASTWLLYNFSAFQEAGQPAWVKTTQREQHVTVNTSSEVLVKVEYSDGFGRLLQTRAQAEEVLFGTAPFGDSGLPANADLANAPAIGHRNTDATQPNVVVSGWQVYDNKGQVVEKYEPFFSQGFSFVASDAAAQGQLVRLFYDPRGQLVRTRNPDNTEQRVVYGTPSGTPAAPVLDRLDLFAPSPWETYTYDANDLADLTHHGLPAAAAVAAHWYTPQSATVDALGRVLQTIDRLEPGGPLVHVVMGYGYDLRGNRIRVTDAYGRTSFRHVYDLKPKAGKDDPGANVLRTEHLDGGTRLALFDGAGQPLHGQDAKGALTLHAYDVLGRPTDAWARDRMGEHVTCRQHLEYGLLAAAATNSVGQLVAHYDEAGVVRLLGYDFKGNLLEKERQVVADQGFTDQWGVQAGLNWSALPTGFNPHWQEQSELGQSVPTERWQDFGNLSRLAPAVYQTSTQYDALNRATRLTLPQEASGSRPQLVPSYNRAGALAQMRLDGQVLVEQVAYNARGQRLLLARGNGLLTRYAYDPTSFRLLRLRTEAYLRAADTLTPQGSVRQDTAYRYDLAGNITATTERAPESGVGGTDQLDRLFKYDALYRLLSATGRENQPTAATPWQDTTRSEGAASTTAYTQRYTYDLLGNIESLAHTAAPSRTSFTRSFSYAPPVLVGPGGRTEQPNYLLDVQVGGSLLADYAYDANGNVLRETQSRHLGWDAADQLRQFATWTGPSSSPTLLAYYVYDASGARTKKLTQTSATTWQVTVYVDGSFEHRYEVNGGGRSDDQTTLYVLDGQSLLYKRRAGNALGDQRPAELYTLEDHLGSASATVDANGVTVSREEYYPFGETSFGSHEKQRYRFCGKELDQESGFYYYGARYYASWLCRFISIDPLAADYPYLTPYNYAGNKSITHKDIDGLQSTGDAPTSGSSGQQGGDKVYFGGVLPPVVVTGIVPRDDYEKSILEGRITFTANYGWVDNTHAFTDTKRTEPFIGTGELWNQLKNEPSRNQIYMGYYSVNYKQDVVFGDLSVGIERQYLVKPGLTLDERKSVALAIFQDVSKAFEQIQGLHPTSGSSFEPADLPSDMLSFYRIVEGIKVSEIQEMIKPVSPEQAIEVYRKYPGTFTDNKYKNKSFKPRYFDSPYTSSDFGVPARLNLIKPAPIASMNYFGKASLILFDQDVIKERDRR